MRRGLAFVALLALVLQCCDITPVVSAMTDTEIAAKRQRVCRSDTDCVIVKTAKGGGTLLLDELDLEGDSLDAIVKKLPGWFGPRPARFMHGGRELNQKRTLAAQGVKIGDSVVIEEAAAGAKAPKDDIPDAVNAEL